MMYPINQANYNVYKSEKSSTFKANGTAFFIGYEDGDEVVGTLVKDTVRIGAMTVKNQTFAQATSFPTKQIYDGILGLGFVSNANSHATTVLDNLFDQKQINEKIFSFYLNRFI
jgi:saccharopepsin